MSPLRNLWPFAEAASAQAQAVDYLAFTLLSLSILAAALICGLALIFTIRYREGAPARRDPVRESAALQIVWVVLPVIVALTTFAWGAAVKVEASRPPDSALEIDAVAKQWAWKFQHPEGRQEINEIHVPWGRPVRLTMTSEDVRHSFYVPALRLKTEVAPGRHSSAWFEAGVVGDYPLLCAEYCGIGYSRMSGRLMVMEPREYEQWLSGLAPGETPVTLGNRLFTELKCDTCHRPDGAGRGPSLEGIFGRTVTLKDGQTVIADDTYVRESILRPGARIVSGYEPVMPVFEGRLTAEQVNGLVTYLRTLERGPAQ